jgi:DNA-directed RNA polymerase specialized sigma24 family protein
MLYQDQGEPEADHALRTAARYVFAHSEAMLSRVALVSFEKTSTSGTATLGRMALDQRRMLALCLYGGYTYRDAAAAMGIAEDTAARLITTGLRQTRKRPF